MNIYLVISSSSSPLLSSPTSPSPPQFMKAGENVFAGGDIARFPLPLTGDTANIGHWQLAHKHGRVAAKNMLGMNQPYDSIPYFWTMIYGKSVRYCGKYTTLTAHSMHTHPHNTHTHMCSLFTIYSYTHTHTHLHILIHVHIHTHTHTHTTHNTHNTTHTTYNATHTHRRHILPLPFCRVNILTTPYCVCRSCR